MAYTFNQINGLLSESGQQNQNIFSGDQGQQQGDASAGGQGASSGGGAKTTTEGELGAGSSSGSAAPAPAKAATNQSSGQAILEKNKNVDSGFSKGIGDSIKNAQTNLENEANNYVTAQKSKAVKPIEDADLENSIAKNRNATSYGLVNNLLYGPKEKADDFRSGVSSRFEDVDQLASQGGLQNYLQQRGDEHYTQGGAALDSLLLSRDKNYKQNIADARTQRALLKQRQEGLEAQDFKGAQQKYLDDARSSAQQGALQALSSKEDVARKQLEKMAAEENMRRDTGRASKASVSKDKLAAAAKDLRGEYGDMTDWLYENYATIDPSKGGQNWGGQTINPEDYFQNNNANFDWRTVGGSDSGRFNAIADLLGQGGERAGERQNIGEAYTYDDNALRQALRNQINARRSVPAKVDIVSGNDSGNKDWFERAVDNPVKASIDPREGPVEIDPRKW